MLPPNTPPALSPASLPEPLPSRSTLPAAAFEIAPRSRRRPALAALGISLSGLLAFQLAAQPASFAASSPPPPPGAPLVVEAAPEPAGLAYLAPLIPAPILPVEPEPLPERTVSAPPSPPAAKPLPSTSSSPASSVPTTPRPAVAPSAAASSSAPSTPQTPTTSSESLSGTSMSAARAPEQPRHERVGQAALEGLPFDAARIGYSIRFEPGRDGVMGLASQANRTVTVYVRPSMGVELTRRVLAHELGHAVDLEFNTDADRERYLLTRGAGPDTPWYPCGSCSDFRAGAGDFAEAFAEYWLSTGVWKSEVAPAPDATQNEELSYYFIIP